MTQDQEGREHQQMKEVWSLWQTLLYKIVLQHMKNFLEPREQKLRRKMHKNQPQLLVTGPLILHDNACPHITVIVTKKTSRLWVGSVISCALQSRYESTGFRFIPRVKTMYAWMTFSSMEELSTDGTRAIRHINESGVLDGIIINIENFLYQMTYRW